MHAVRCATVDAILLDPLHLISEKRKKLGMAEVTLTLADCEEALKTDYNEVSITRRVYADGKSEFLINNTRCRLREPAHIAGGRPSARRAASGAGRGTAARREQPGAARGAGRHGCAASLCEASERRGTAGKGERAHRHHG